jgi:hypothetical protein
LRAIDEPNAQRGSFDVTAGAQDVLGSLKKRDLRTAVGPLEGQNRSPRRSVLLRVGIRYPGGKLSQPTSVRGTDHEMPSRRHE